MYGIGTVARLAQVSVRTLRYYAEIGLLRPVWTDPETGHRWYAPDQLPRLHRILAFRDFGVGLTDIARLLDAAVSADELRGFSSCAVPRPAKGSQPRPNVWPVWSPASSN